MALSTVTAMPRIASRLQSRTVWSSLPSHIKASRWPPAGGRPMYAGLGLLSKWSRSPPSLNCAKPLRINQVQTAEIGSAPSVAGSSTSGLLIRRSLVRAQVGEPIYTRPAALRAVSFCSAIRALLRQFDDPINTETRGTSAVWKLPKSFEPLRSDRLCRDDQEDPIGEPIGIELTLRAALEKIGAQVVHFGGARSQEVTLDGPRT